MKGKLLLAAVALVSMSVAALPDEEVDKRVVGAWHIRSIRSRQVMDAQNSSHMALSNGGVGTQALFSFGCFGGEIDTVGFGFDGNLDIQKVTYRVADGPEITTNKWEIKKSFGTTQVIWPRSDTLAFVRSLPSSGKMRVRVDLKDGYGEVTFDLNGIDAVRHTLDDICKAEQ